MGTSTDQEHEQRSRELADSLRSFLIAVNTGGIGAMLLVAGNLAEQKVNPSWTFWPVLCFVGGLLATGWSIFAAQHRAEERLKSHNAGIQFSRWWQSAPWNVVALGAFLIGSILGLVRLSWVTLQ